VRFAFFWWARALLPFWYRKSPAVCLRYQKQKIVFPLPDVFRFGLDVKNK
jgi:hypothetical protein